MGLRLWTATALTALGLVLSPQANATPSQDRLLFDTMASVGIVLYPNAVTAAYAVCAEVWGGRDLNLLAQDVLEGNTGWTNGQAQVFVAAAVSIYCPPSTDAHKKLT